MSEVTFTFAQKAFFSALGQFAQHPHVRRIEWIYRRLPTAPSPHTYTHTQKKFIDYCSAHRPDARFRCAAVRAVSTSSCAGARFRAAQAIVVFWVIFVFLGGMFPWAARLPDSMSHKQKNSCQQEKAFAKRIDLAGEDQIISCFSFLDRVYWSRWSIIHELFIYWLYWVFACIRFLTSEFGESAWFISLVLDLSRLNSAYSSLSLTSTCNAPLRSDAFEKRRRTNWMRTLHQRFWFSLYLNN